MFNEPVLKPGTPQLADCSGNGSGKKKTAPLDAYMYQEVVFNWNYKRNNKKILLQQWLSKHFSTS